jgi:malate dehydrogenase
MSLSIAILGASGAVGSVLSAQILRAGILEPGDRLQLVGHGEEVCLGKLFAIRIDLLDAFDDLRVQIEVASNAREAEADVVIVAEGVAMPGTCLDRREMGRANVPIFRRAADACAARLPDAIFIILSNPVELAVQIFAESIDRKRIVGMGAEQDSLRFARAIAHTLGLHRNDVRASVWGEHGNNMLPMWSSVRLHTGAYEKHQALDNLTKLAEIEPLQARVISLRTLVHQHLEKKQIGLAYDSLDAALPDARIFVEPFVTASAIHSTPNATANAVINILHGLRAEDKRQLHGQVHLDGELESVSGILGIPISISYEGWQLHQDWIHTESEQLRLAPTARTIQSFLQECM